MRVMSVALPYTRKADKCQKTNVNFGVHNLSEYKRVLEEVYNKTSIKNTKIMKLEFNKDYLNCLIMRAWTLPRELTNPIFYELNKFLTRTNNDFNKLPRYTDSIGLGRNQSIDLIKDDRGETLVGLHNLGPYDKGLFSKTDHDQIVLEFRNPDTGHFVGFSRDSEDGVAVTKNNERVELDLYDNFFYYKSLSRQGYKPSVYVDYKGGGGSSSGGSFWDWLNNL